MTTNNEILAFLKADQEARMKEREADREQRNKERKEDIQEILKILQGRIEREVKKSIEPLETRLELQEKVNKELFEQLSIAKNNIQALQEVLSGPHEQALPAVVQVDSLEDQEPSDVQELCSAARKVVGLSPIEPRMLDLQMESYGAKNIEEAKLLEVKSYLKCEMKMLPSKIEKLNIIRIFPPAKENWKVLYVEFSDSSEVDKIFSYTKNLTKRDHRVTHWIPKQMYERYRGVESLAFSIRKDEGLKTRVKIGKTDFILRTRTPTSQLWSTRQLPGSIPKIDLHFSTPKPSIDNQNQVET